MRIQNINKFYVVSGLVILAALLRLPTLGSPLMEDEGIMFSRYSGLSWDTLLLKYDTTNQHTLYLLLSDFCISLFGKNEIAFRDPIYVGKWCIFSPPSQEEKTTCGRFFRFKGVKTFTWTDSNRLFLPGDITSAIGRQAHPDSN